MNKKFLKLNIKKTVKFKHWKNAGWSAFNSLGKHIIISVLPFAYFTTSVFTLDAQTDTLQMQEVTINSSRIPTLYSESAGIIYTIERKEIEEIPVSDLQDLLDYVSNIDIRQRGTEGVQADVNIRGGNFDQTLILLNGFKISDVQTGHHSLNLPVNIDDIERIEILEGPGNRIFGINAYSGAVNFITRDKNENRIKTNLFAGQNDLLGGNVNISGTFKKSYNYFSVSYKQSKGYLTDSINNTDFNILNLFYQNETDIKFAKLSLQAGYTDKSFGANSFYSPKFPWQYEQTKTSFAAFKIKKRTKYYSVTNRIYFRRNQDRFELFREDKFKHTGNYFIYGTDTAKYISGVYEDWNYYSGHNYHLTNFLGAELKLNLFTKAGRTAFGAEYSYAEIKSNVLGELIDTPEKVPGEPDGMFTKSKHRNNINIYAEHFVRFNKLTMSGGASINIDDNFNRNFSGGTDLSYALTKTFKYFVSANQSARLPTFTDLYYNGPVNTGNPDLVPETALTYETGLKFGNKNIKANISLFRRNGKNIIDWVRLSDTLVWQAMNITQLTANGAEFAVSCNFSSGLYLQNISFSYSYTDVVKQSNEYISKYALDYLKHKAVISVSHKIYKSFSGNWKIKFEDREGTYSAYDLNTKTYTGEQEYLPFALTDVRIMQKNKKFEVYVDVTNIFNIEYNDFGNITMPGRQFKAGVRIKLNY